MTGARKILFVTGTRADFGKLKPLLRAVDGARDFECHVFATGMHTLPRYGETVHEIEKAGFRHVETFPNQPGGPRPRDAVLAATVQGLGEHVRGLGPDLLVVHGDRLEALAGATVGAFNGVLTAHVEGGELSGTVDEIIRHAVTKLSHLHFVSNGEAARRLVQLGELPETVFVIGSPEVDVMLSDELPTLDEVQAKYEIPFERYLLFTYHPVTTEPDELPERIDQVLGALQDSGRNFVVIYPNNDPGSEAILDALEGLEGHPRFRILPSMRFEHYLTLLKNARAAVGNSSSVVREAPVYGVPAVNLGSRQRNRCHSESILDVQETREALLAALERLPEPFAPSLQFGRGRSAEAFIECIRRPTLWSTSPQKQFRDLEDVPRGYAGTTP
ncbi:MAG: UDP-N-acetylglucosamine 2-epimerase [Acidobacteriota bacterium]